MVRGGQIVLFHFPQTDLQKGKLRPALIIGKLPGSFEDWLICMISTQLHHYIQGFDEIIAADDVDFIKSGLKDISVIRLGRLAAVDSSMLLGGIGEINPERLSRARANLAAWINHL